MYAHSHQTFQPPYAKAKIQADTGLPQVSRKPQKIKPQQPSQWLLSECFYRAHSSQDRIISAVVSLAVSPSHMGEEVGEQRQTHSNRVCQTTLGGFTLQSHGSLSVVGY